MVDSFKKFRQTHGVAVTGNIGSGKSTIVKRLDQLGYFCIDADQLSRKIAEPDGIAYQDIITHFGPEILSNEGTINRKKLGEIVFSSKESKQKLEAITHPRIQGQLEIEVKKHFQNKSPDFWFYEAALIFEANQQELFYRVLLGYCSQATQQNRLIERGLSKDQIAKIRSYQISPREARSLASWSIDNDDSLEELHTQIDRFLDFLKKDTDLSPPLEAPNTPSKSRSEHNEK